MSANIPLRNKNISEICYTAIVNGTFYDIDVLSIMQDESTLPRYERIYVLIMIKPRFSTQRASFWSLELTRNVDGKQRDKLELRSVDIDFKATRWTRSSARDIIIDRRVLTETICSILDALVFDREVIAGLREIEDVGFCRRHVMAAGFVDLEKTLTEMEKIYRNLRTEGSANNCKDGAK